MHLPKSFWASLTWSTAWLNPAPVDKTPDQGTLLPGELFYDNQNAASERLAGAQPSPLAHSSGPIFTAPDSEHHSFQCNYSRMAGWVDCSTPENRQCWLRNTEDGRILGINSNYELSNETPDGIERKYILTIGDDTYDGDGKSKLNAKLFSEDFPRPNEGKTFPGPYIEACWGDTISVKVVNKMNHNGTSIHWHGIRQHLSMHMDGVNGVTQCPIAPNDHFTYTWKAKQYGSFWYHSHYSVQYADGALGPLTIHGPASASYDECRKPLIMNDWAHNSAFQALHDRPAHDRQPGQEKKYGPLEPSILLNGKGNLAKYSGGKHPGDRPPPRPYTVIVEKGNANGAEPRRAKRYLLRLINASYGTTFVFSIDNHWLQVVQADFVPIVPYFTTSVLVGIGQRYHVIVEARPDKSADGSNPIPKDRNFWMRTEIATGCGAKPRGTNNEVVPGYEETGIFSYYGVSAALPTSKRWGNINIECRDEPFDKLVPIVPWVVGDPKNQRKPHEQGEQDTGQWFDMNFPGEPSAAYPLGVFSMDPHYASQEGNHPGMNPFRVNYSDPMIKHLDYKGDWPKQLAVIPEDYTKDDWVWMVILGGDIRKAPVLAHPIHLHGHDFALLYQSEAPYDSWVWDRKLVKLNNPPRRDVVLVPARGFVIIAFKTDNPGDWLLHCHIARHATEGLSMQILERQDAAQVIANENKDETERVCTKWNEWVSDCQNWWHGNEKEKKCQLNDPKKPQDGYIFLDDSGV